MFEKKLTLMSLLCVLISILMLFTGCNSAQNSRIDSASNFGEHPQEDSAVLTIHGILEEKTEDQLFEQSSLVVIGTVQDAGNAFQVKSSAGDLCNFTDYTLAIDTVLRGEHEKNELIVRINGGTAGGVTEVYTPSPELKIGEDYLLFLYQPARGGSFNTKGDYYCILGLTQGVFQKTENTVSAKNTDVYISQEGYEMAYEHIKNRACEYPVDKQYFRNEYIENQKRNLANGFISQSEYNNLMKTIDVYADVVAEKNN